MRATCYSIVALVSFAVQDLAIAHSDPFTIADASYLAAIRNAQSGTVLVSGNERYLTEIGLEICRRLRSNTTVDELVRDVGARGVSAYDAFVVTAAASVHYCPDTVSKINNVFAEPTVGARGEE